MHPFVVIMISVPNKTNNRMHDDVIKWKHFPRYWPFVRGIHRTPVNSPHKGQWRGALIFFICAWINGWVNNCEIGDLRPNRGHYDVTSCDRLSASKVTLTDVSYILQNTHFYKRFKMQELSDYEYDSNLYEYVLEFLHRVSGIWMFKKTPLAIIAIDIGWIVYLLRMSTC